MSQAFSLACTKMPSLDPFTQDSPAEFSPDTLLSAEFAAIPNVRRYRDSQADPFVRSDCFAGIHRWSPLGFSSSGPVFPTNQMVGRDARPRLPMRKHSKGRGSPGQRVTKTVAIRALSSFGVRLSVVQLPPVL